MGYESKRAEAVRLLQELFKEICEHTGRKLTEEQEDNISDAVSAIVDSVADEFHVVRK